MSSLPGFPKKLAGGNSGSPVGEIIQAAGLSDTDYLRCDGSIVNQGDYPKLFNAIGHKVKTVNFVEQLKGEISNDEHGFLRLDYHPSRDCFIGMLSQGSKAAFAISYDDCLTWETISTPTSFSSVAVKEDGTFVGGSGTTLYTSTDNGVTWSTYNNSSKSTTEVVYSGVNFIAGGSTDNTVYYSSDGLSWASTTTGGDGNIASLTSNGTYTISTDGGGTSPYELYITLDHGVSWQVEVSPTIIYDQGVAYPNGNFIFSADSDETVLVVEPLYTNTVKTETTVNGLTGVGITARASYVITSDGLVLVADQSDTAYGYPVTQVINGQGNKTVAAKGNKLFIADDGSPVITIIEEGSKEPFWFNDSAVTYDRIIHDGTKFVAISINANVSRFQMATSTDGYYWTPIAISGNVLDLSDEPGDLADIVYTGGVYYVLTTSGIILRSTDLSKWTSNVIDGASTATFESFDYDGSSVWVVVSSDDSIYSTTDPMGTWTSRTNASGTRMVVVKYANSVWVAAGETGDLQTSSDGTTWTDRTANVNTVQWIRALEYDTTNSLWILAGDAGALETTADPTTAWTTRTSNTTNAIQSVRHLNGANYYCTLASDVGHSTNGTTWTKYDVTQLNGDTAADFHDIAWDGSTQYVMGAADNAFCYSSTPAGTIWGCALMETLSNGSSLKSVVFNPSNRDLGCAVDNNGYIYVTANSGDTWTVADSSTDNNYHKVAYVNGYYVALGRDTTNLHDVFKYSTDLGTWTENASAIGGNYDVFDMAYDGTRYQAATSNGMYYNTTISAATWTQGQVGNFQAVEYSSEIARLWANGTGGTFYYSDNGTSWTSSTAAGQAMYDLWWDGRAFISVGNNSTAYRCLGTATTWTSVSIAGTVGNFNAGGYIPALDMSIAIGSASGEVAGFGNFPWEGSGGIDSGSAWGGGYGSVDYSNKYAFLTTLETLPGYRFDISDISVNDYLIGTPNTYFENIEYISGADKYIIPYGNTANSSNFEYLKSSDGVTWTPVDDARFVGPVSVAYKSSNNTVIMIEKDDVIPQVSTNDGVTWVDGGSTSLTNQKFIAYNSNADQWMIIISNYGYAYSTNDGTSWTAVSGNGLDSLLTNKVRVLSDNHFWITAASGTLVKALGNSHTSFVIDYTVDLHDIADSGSIKVIVGTEGNIYYSTDDATWTSANITTKSGASTTITNNLYAVKWATDKFYAVGDGIVLASSDGITWTIEKDDFTETLRDLYWNDTDQILIMVGAMIMTAVPSYDSDTQFMIPNLTSYETESLGYYIKAK